MKKNFVVCCAFLLISNLAFAQPKLRIVEGSKFDLGEVFQGEKIEHKLTLKNVGDKPLVIEKVQASCGCTATLLADKTVKPRKTTSLSITFDSKTFSGTVHKSVSVFSNDPDTASREITFTANVIRVLESNPPYIYFPPSKLDTTLKNTVVLKNVSGKPIEILGVTCDEPGVEIELRKKELDSGEATLLSITFTPSRLGYIYKDVIVKTSHPKQPQFTMKLVCNVQAKKPK
jgi:hypothetical protein